MLCRRCSCASLPVLVRNAGRNFRGCRSQFGAHWSRCIDSPPPRSGSHEKEQEPVKTDADSITFSSGASGIVKRWLPIFNVNVSATSLASNAPPPPLLSLSSWRPPLSPRCSEHTSVPVENHGGALPREALAETCVDQKRTNEKSSNFFPPY